MGYVKWNFQWCHHRHIQPAVKNIWAFKTDKKILFNRKWKNLTNLHTREKVSLVGRKMCHNHPTHMITSSVTTIFQQTSEASCECVFLCIKFLSKCEQKLKLVTYNTIRQVRLFQPFSNLIIKFVMAVLKDSWYSRRWMPDLREGIMMGIWYG